MWQILKRYPRAYLWSVLLHLALLVLMLTGIDWLVRNQKVGGFEIINLGGGNKPYTLNYVIELIEEYVGKEAMRVLKPFHKADLKSTWANIDKAKKLLTWEPKIALEDGVRRSVEWYFENRRWLRSVEL